MRNVTKAFSRTLALALLLMVSTMAWAQQRISGTVTDAKGETLIGVSVKQAGTQNGVTTNINGQFTITVPQGANLEFSYIGYTPTTVRAANGMTVILQDDNQLLEEVVVVGYGTMRRKDVTSSITTVQAKDLNTGVFTDPAQLLQGKVAGLTVTSNGDPNGTPSITLRGASSLRESAMSPYYVIDGIPGVDISMVAPDDIESIDVLRDASATAIYGSKAANGVIIITTKSGQEGRTNVSYNAYVAFDKVSKTLDMASASDITAFVNNPAHYVNGAPVPGFGAGGNTDWQDEVLRTGFSHNHNLSINGGNGQTKYMASLNYTDREGVVRSTNMNRLNARSLITTSVLKDRLQLSIGVNAMQGKHEGVRTGIDGASVLDAMNYYAPTNPIKAADGSWYNTNEKQNYNPLSLMHENRSETIWKRMQFIGKASLKLFEGLVWNANYSLNSRQSTYASYDSSDNQVDQGYTGIANRNTYKGQDQTFETYGNYDVTLGKVHKLGLMAGYTWEERESGDGFGVTVRDFYDDALSWHNLSYGATLKFPSDVQSGVQENIRNISFYGRLNYSYNSRYMLTASIRRDGSSVFGKNHQWGTFPAVSAAWNISEEPFMQGSAFDQLKLRVGYGVSGNAMGFGAYTARERYVADGVFTYNGVTMRTIKAAGNANPDLKWESTGMFNIGLDFAFLNSRVNGSLEFYNKKTWDLIWDYSVSTAVYPYGWMTANVGDITNRGVELTLNIVPVRTKDFQWQTTINLAHNQNKVDKLSNDTYSVDYIDKADANIVGMSSFSMAACQRILEGEPLGTFWTLEWAGYDSDGKSTYYKHDPVTGERTGETTTNPTYTDRTKAGSAQPKLTYGWNNTLNYKNWSLTAFFQGVLGNKIMNTSKEQYSNKTMFAGGKNVLADALANPNFWTDTNANLPSDKYLEDGSYLRLANITLGYTFRNLGGWAESLNLYATANNLLTITSYDGLDPEVNLGGLTPGMDYRYTFYPHTRSFLFGAKINFATKAEKKAAPGQTVYVSDNDEINRLRAEIEQLKNRQPGTTVIDNSRIVTFPYLVNFVIGQSELANREKVNLETVAQMIKATPEKKYSVYGYADKQTGSVERNAQLALERSVNVYDILTKQYGVPASQLVREAKGGVDVMYLNDPQLSRSVIISEVK
jgi:iron complex outermembrane receptor protein